MQQAAFVSNAEEVRNLSKKYSKDIQLSLPVQQAAFVCYWSGTVIKNIALIDRLKFAALLLR